VSLRIVDVGHERVALTAGGRTVPSVVVRFVVRIAGAALPGGVRVIVVAHAVDDGGRWRWILPAARLDRYRSRVCGSATAPPA